ncbi:hypothetical protein HQQ94_03775 [Shewanella sp. VB17]|uniref:capsular polysaccharide export protein, LipB/KpsS family n=1 Tax=Shewanella sp. VB17 TaxID=2739432 RepID=UPI001562EF91|nr:hypothetical protein [Shewanella sp. VB17]NRD72375.1 hypothetical protein [Shewanella sp. VB17]
MIGRVNIIIQSGDHLENKKRILPVALQLKSQGYNPIVLVYKSKEETFFLHHGIDSVSLENYRHKNRIKLFIQRNVVKKNPDILSYNGVSFNDVFSVELQRGRRLNDHAKKSIIYHIQILSFIIEDIDPITIFIWNGYTGFCANTLRNICQLKTIKSFYMERSLLKSGVFFDSEGVNGFSSLCNEVTKSELVQYNGSEQKHIKIKGKLNLTKNYFSSKWNKILFLPLQVQSDTNIILFSHNVKTMRELVLTILNSIPNDTLLVIRHHPEEVEQQLNLPLANNILYSNDESLNYWISVSDLVVTINSTVGFEALISGRPVLTFGKSIYSGKGLCKEVNELDQLKGVLADEETYRAPNIEIIKNYANILVGKHTCISGELNSELIYNFPVVKNESVIFYNSYKVNPTKVKIKAQDIYKKLGGF